LTASTAEQPGWRGAGWGGLAALGLLTAAVGARRLGDFDLPWHLASGRMIVEARGIPRVDALSFTHHPIRSIELVSDLVLFGVYRAGGAIGLQLLNGLVAAATLGLMARRARGSGGPGLCVMALAAAALSGWLILRPASFSFALIALTLLLLEAHRAAPDAPRARRGLVSLVPLLALWANLHGFAVLGVGLVGLYALDRLVAALRGAAPRHAARDAVLVAAGAAVAACLSPGGWLVYAGPLVAARAGREVTEWAAPGLRFFLDVVPAAGVFGLVSLVAIALGRSEGRRLPGVFDAALLALALAMASRSVRMIPVAIVIAAPIVARRVAGMVRLGPRVSGALAAVAVALAPALVLAFADVRPGIGFAPSHFPARAVAWVERARPKGNPWNFFPFGGYLELRLHPAHLTFIDGRTAWVHPLELFLAQQRGERDHGEFARLEQRWHFDWAVCGARPSDASCLPVAARRDWVMVHWDDVAAVYVRATGPNRELARHGYHLLRHTTPPFRILELAVTPGELSSHFEHDARLAREQDPESSRAAFLAACAAVAARDEARLRSTRAEMRALGAPDDLVTAVEQAWRMARAAPPR
jgi:hypothetical protein